MRAMLSGLVLAMVSAPHLTAQRGRTGPACLTLLDQRGQHPVVGAMLTALDRTAPRITVRTDSTGRGCIAGRDTVALRVDALGFIPVDLALATASPQPMRLFALPESGVEPEWARAQLRTALTEAASQAMIAHDTVGTAVLQAVLRRADSVPPEVTVTRDSAGQVMFGYVDLSIDGSYTSELRLRYAAGRSLVIGVTTRHCDESCAREYDVAVSWVARDGAGWVAEHVARKDANGEPVVVALGAPVTVPAADTSAMDAAATAVTAAPRPLTVVRGTVRDDKGKPVPNIEIYTADGTATTTTNADGTYQLSVPMPPGGVLLTTRRIGFAPAFHTVPAAEGAAVTWNPSVKPLTVLARQLVTATGVPDQLRSFRYNDFLTRRARGIGQFFMTEEIWSAMSLGDVLNRANGVSVSFTFGNRISRIRIPGCNAPQVLGIYLDGINETDASKPAAEILQQFVSSAIVGMEVYNTRGEIPGEFARPEYCAVIALWTR